MRFVTILLVVLYGCSRGETDTNSKSDSPHHTVADTTQIAEMPSPWFVDVALEIGVDFEYFSGDTGNYYIIETISGGTALFDYDNDGDLDLYMTQGNVLEGETRDDLTNKLYENIGDGKFVDRTTTSGVGDTHYGVGVTTGDYNNDGFVDLYVTNFGRNTLLRNNGDSTFTDVTEQAGVGGNTFSACAEFADLDADGDLDLFVTNYLDWTTESEMECFSKQNFRNYCKPEQYDARITANLYFNNGDGTFVDVTQTSGIGSKPGVGLGVAIAPINDDHYPDIFVANDGMEDRLWINKGDGTFHDEANILGCAVDDTGKGKASMGVVVADIDVDGDLDLLITTLFRETDSFFLNHEGVFVDATARWGLAADTRTYTRWGIALMDFNNDGLEDLYEATGRVSKQADVWDEDDPLAEPNLLFTQARRGRFTLVNPSGGVATPLIGSSHGVAAGDINNDGGIDLVIVNKDAKVNVLRNIVEDRGGWIVLDVRNEYGSPAIGAIVKVTLQDGSFMTKLVRASQGYASASDPRVHIGLGDATEIQHVSVRWPLGNEATFGPLTGGRVHILTP